MRNFFLLLFVFLISCSLNKVDKNSCINGDEFNVIVVNEGLNKIDRKIIISRIINDSSINFNRNSNYVVELKINMRKNTALISPNNTTELENISFIVNYKVLNKNNGVIIDKGRFIVVDEVDVSESRFANYATDKYIMDNFTKNLIVKLEGRLRLLLKNKSCLSFK